MIGCFVRRARLRAGGDRGSATAEFAIVLPVLVLLLALGAGLLGAGGARVRLEDAAADAARVLARGEGESAASGIVARAVPRADAAVSREGGFVCVTASATVRLLGTAGMPLQAHSCALDGGR